MTSLLNLVNLEADSCWINPKRKTRKLILWSISRKIRFSTRWPRQSWILVRNITRKERLKINKILTDREPNIQRPTFPSLFQEAKKLKKEKWWNRRKFLHQMKTFCRFKVTCVGVCLFQASTLLERHWSIRMVSTTDRLQNPTRTPASLVILMLVISELNRCEANSFLLERLKMVYIPGRHPCRLRVSSALRVIIIILGINLENSAKVCLMSVHQTDRGWFFTFNSDLWPLRSSL